jgi:hypothetical protein
MYPRSQVWLLEIELLSGKPRAKSGNSDIEDDLNDTDNNRKDGEQSFIQKTYLK